jgi:transposase InsO family protein
VDRTTRWPEALPLSSTTAVACTAALFHGWIAHFGVPDMVTSDRGSQFTPSLCAAVCDLLQICHICTTAFHPQANGLVERLHRRLKDSLRARMTTRYLRLVVPATLDTPCPTGGPKRKVGVLRRQGRLRGSIGSPRLISRPTRIPFAIFFRGFAEFDVRRANTSSTSQHRRRRGTANCPARGPHEGENGLSEER